MKWFGNDDDGLTVVDAATLPLTIAAIYIAIRYGDVGNNFGELAIAALLCTAGQKGWSWYTQRRYGSTCNPINADTPDNSNQSNPGIAGKQMNNGV
jgi:hypothetical protein